MSLLTSLMMTQDEVNRFEKVQGQFEGLHKEIGILSRKNPNDAVNKFKLKFINQLLKDGNEILKDNYKPLDDFEAFDEDELPSNSDVTFIFELYLNCFEKLRRDNIEIYNASWYWVIDGNRTQIKTSEPKKIKN